eukprot:scaffold64781_cov16-Prasinocladus_malaysianus.AAC.2
MVSASAKIENISDKAQLESLSLQLWVAGSSASEKNGLQQLGLRAMKRMGASSDLQPPFAPTNYEYTLTIPAI